MNRTPSSTGSQMRLQRKSMAGEVADELRRRILSGEIDEGTQLMQEQLAAEFGISKVPIREALFQLEAEGFVTQQFHRGAVVSGLSPAEIMEIFELRVQIEMWLLELGMAAATDEDIADARSLADQFEASDDPVVAWELNWRFHEALYRPAGKPFAVEHLKKLHFQTARYVQTQYGVAIDKHKITAEHLELLDRYQQKSQKTKMFLRNHIIVAAKKLTEHLSKLQKKA